MKVRILQRFRDKFDHVTWYEIGTEHEFDPERAGNLAGRGLVEEVEETIPAGEKEPVEIKEPVKEPVEIKEPVKVDKPGKEKGTEKFE